MPLLPQFALTLATQFMSTYLFGIFAFNIYPDKCELRQRCLSLVGSKGSGSGRHFVWGKYTLRTWISRLNLKQRKADPTPSISAKKVRPVFWEGKSTPGIGLQQRVICQMCLIMTPRLPGTNAFQVNSSAQLPSTLSWLHRNINQIR